jgi:hydrogenase small subunit
MACTMPGFPDRFLPFMDSSPLVRLSTQGGRFEYGPVLRRFRERSMRRYDRAGA